MHINRNNKFCTKNQFTKIYKDPTDVYQKKIKQQYTVYRDMRYSLSWTISHWIMYCQRCLYTQAGKYKQLGLKWHKKPINVCCYSITAVWTAVVNSCNCNILRFLMTGRVTGTWSTCWTNDPLFLINRVKMDLGAETFCS